MIINPPAYTGLTYKLYLVLTLGNASVGCERPSDDPVTLIRRCRAWPAASVTTTLTLPVSAQSSNSTRAITGD
eukprot:1181241-Prorocentrum_minimum.AAC.3